MRVERVLQEVNYKGVIQMRLTIFLYLATLFSIGQIGAEETDFAQEKAEMKRIEEEIQEKKRQAWMEEQKRVERRRIERKIEEDRIQRRREDDRRYYNR